ncbi:MAG: 3'-5' exonuclease [Egibacteraceae bacterium]
MGQSLTDDEEYRATTFVLIDFETTTPKGYRPEPVEVAVVTLRDRGDGLAEVSRFCELIRPPAHAPITPLDTAKNGLRPDDVVDARLAPRVLADLDGLLASPPYLLVAHNAHIEAGLLYDYREHCPRLAATHLIDTIKLARTVLPGLSSYSLDHLMAYLGIPRPARRHRALPDVEVTARLFTRLITDGCWSCLRELTKISGLVPRATQPHQDALF